MEIRNRPIHLDARLLIHNKDVTAPHPKEITVLIILSEQMSMYVNKVILLYTSITSANMN